MFVLLHSLKCLNRLSYPSFKFALVWSLGSSYRTSPFGLKYNLDGLLIFDTANSVYPLDLVFLGIFPYKNHGCQIASSDHHGYLALKC